MTKFICNEEDLVAESATGIFNGVTVYIPAMCYMMLSALCLVDSNIYIIHKISGTTTIERWDPNFSKNSILRLGILRDV